jgi:hypothetical protein
MDRRTKFNHRSYSAYVDDIKAFNVVNRNIWYRLKLKELLGHLVRLTQSQKIPCIIMENGDRRSNRNNFINQGVLQSVHYHLSFLICVWAMLQQKGRKVMISVVTFLSADGRWHVQNSLYQLSDVASRYSSFLHHNNLRHERKRTDKNENDSQDSSPRVEAG